MKKTYINPTTKVVELGTTSLICDSLKMGSTELEGVAGSRIRGTRTKDGSLEDFFE